MKTPKYPTEKRAYYYDIYIDHTIDSNTALNIETNTQIDDVSGCSSLPTSCMSNEEKQGNQEP